MPKTRLATSSARMASRMRRGPRPGVRVSASHARRSSSGTEDTAAAANSGVTEDEDKRDPSRNASLEKSTAVSCLRIFKEFEMKVRCQGSQSQETGPR